MENKWAALGAEAGGQCQALSTCHPYAVNLDVPPSSTGSVGGSFFPIPPEWHNKASTWSPTHMRAHTAPLDCLISQGGQHETRKLNQPLAA